MVLCALAGLSAIKRCKNIEIVFIIIIGVQITNINKRNRSRTKLTNCVLRTL
jgi:hypothetical protein